MKSRKKLVLILLILTLTTLFVGFLLPYNYPSDIYNIFELGYKEYANTWFLTSGRIICVLIFYIFNYFNIPINIAIFISKIFSILIATSCIYIFYNIMIKIIKIDNKITKIGIFFLVLLIFLNSSSYEFFYYIESSVMLLGLFLIVLAILINENNKTYKYIKIFICLLISINCYQSAILFTCNCNEFIYKRKRYKNNNKRKYYKFLSCNYMSFNWICNSKIIKIL